MSQKKRQPPAMPWVSDDNVALFTDLYELTMMQVYVEEEIKQEAVFSLYVRNLPPERNFLLACGLDLVLDYLEGLTFGRRTIDYLRSLDRFSPKFLEWLKAFRFSGDVHAAPEGTALFGNEPLVEVVGPIAEAQLVETFVMNVIHHQTLIASKAARVVEAAAGRGVVDFATRREHGLTAAVNSARACYIAGAVSTSNVLAGEIYRIPVAGTMAHSFVQSFDRERDAFRAFMRHYPDTILLVDTYDTLDGVRNVIALAQELGSDFHVRGVRLDSGDLATLARDARRLLDDAGLESVRIFASGGLDEYKLRPLIEAGAPIDAFGVGTNMGVSADVPALDIAYKLTEFAGKGRTKLSPSKAILPGRKQIYRREQSGEVAGDVLALHDEVLPGRPLLEQVMQGGKRTGDRSKLDDIRTYARRQIGTLPPRLRSLDPADPPYPVEISDGLGRLRDTVASKAAEH